MSGPNTAHRSLVEQLLASVLAPWTSHGARINHLEIVMSAQSDAFAEMDAQLDALESYVNSDDATDAAQVSARTQRIKTLLAAVNVADPAPQPSETADEPGPTPVPADEVSPDVPAGEEPSAVDEA